MSRNPLWIDPNSGSLAEQVRAIINVLNANTNEMYVGRVPQAQKDIRTADEKIDGVNATQSITFVTLAESGQIDAVTAGEHAELFEEWKYPIKYEVGQLRKYNGVLYRCISSHDSQETWTPDVSPSLWDAASDPAEEFPEWSRPVGDFDAYHIGDRVTYNGKKWECTATDAGGNNTWQPDVYGWTEVS